jgi:hypothetical protein
MSLPEVAWSVSVRANWQDVPAWRAQCDTLDEAVELASNYEKRYFVAINSVPRF